MKSWFLVTSGYSVCSRPSRISIDSIQHHLHRRVLPSFPFLPPALSLSRSIRQRNVEDIFYRQAYPGASLLRLDQVINPLSFPVVIVRSTNLKSTLDLRSSLISHIHCLFRDSFSTPIYSLISPSHTISYNIIYNI